MSTIHRKNTCKGERENGNDFTNGGLGAEGTSSRLELKGHKMTVVSLVNGWYTCVQRHRVRVRELPHMLHRWWRQEKVQPIKSARDFAKHMFHGHN